MSSHRPTRRQVTSRAIYGIISVAVVIVASEGATTPGELIALVAGYGVAIWMTHAYVEVVASGRTVSWGDAIREEVGIPLATVPALVVAILGAVLGWDAKTTVLVALGVCLVELVTVQVMILRTFGTRRAELVATVLVDAFTGGLLVVFQLFVKH